MLSLISKEKSTCQGNSPPATDRTCSQVLVIVALVVLIILVFFMCVWIVVM